VYLYPDFSLDSMEDGVPDEDVLEELFVELGNSWEPVARRLKFKDAKVTAIHKDIRNTLKKSFENVISMEKERCL